MATIARFEDLVCWQKARELTRGVYKNLRDCRDYGFKDQIQRAAVSVVSNIKDQLVRYAHNYTPQLMLGIFRPRRIRLWRKILKHLNI